MNKPSQKNIWLSDTYENYAEETYVTMSDGVKLRVLHTKPNTGQYLPPLVLVPGLGSIVPGWDRVLLPLKDKIPIYYIETREKKSSKFPKKKKFEPIRFGYDLKEVLDYFNIKDKEYVIMGSSLGANTIIYALANHYIDPLVAIIIGPNPTFPIPTPLKVILPLIPIQTVDLLRPLIKWYVKIFEVDMKTEPEQGWKYERVVDEMEGWKIKYVACGFKDMYLYPMLHKIKAPSILIGAIADKMHKAENTKKFAELIPNAVYVELFTNKAAHSEPMVHFITGLYKHIDDPLGFAKQYSLPEKIIAPYIPAKYRKKQKNLV